MCSDFREQELGGDFEAGIKLGNNSNSSYNIFLKDGPLKGFIRTAWTQMSSKILQFVKIDPI